MAEQLMVKHDEMAAAAGKLKTEWGNMTESVDAITGIVNDIPNFWRADTATKYMDQYSDLKHGLDDAAQLIYDLAEQMSQISANFQDVDTDMAGQMGR